MSIALVWCLVISDFIQNTTIEVRVTLLEIQAVVIQDDITGLGVDLTELEGDVNFLFDEQIIQDERLFSLEQTTIGRNEELYSLYTRRPRQRVFICPSKSTLN